MSRAFYTPEELLYDLGIETPEEIDIEAIAEHCGATVVYEPLAGCAARILGLGNRAIITVASGSLPARRRFSAAHELGHWMCDRGRIGFSCTEQALTTNWGDANPERRANGFAAELLLPKRIFRERSRALEPSLANCRSLAKQFATSLTATALRLVELGPRVAVAVCTEQGQRRWMWRSEDVPPGIELRRIPGADTEAGKAARGGRCEEGPWEVSADEWFIHPRADEYRIYEDAVEIAPGVVLTLLWWRDERMLAEIGWSGRPRPR